MHVYEIGQRVRRIEDRPTRGAIVLEIAASATDPSLRIAYEEGGEGWWPEGAIEPEAEET